MMNNKKRNHGLHRLQRLKNEKIVSLLIFSLMITGCFWVKAKLDPMGQELALTIQKQTPGLMDKAANSFYQYRNDVYKLMTLVEEAYENARTLRKNDSITGMWNVLRSPNGNRLGKFMKMWEWEGKLDQDTIKTYKEWVMKDIDAIVKLEEEKKK